MDALHHLSGGFLVALTPINLLWAFAGAILGTAIGVLPGIGPALTIALLLPVTTKMNPTGAFIMFAGILYGAMYGGSTTSHPAEHARRERRDHDRARGQPRWRGAAAAPPPRHGGDRIVRRRHARHHRC